MGRSAGKLAFHFAVFLSGFLLFQVQPFTGNAILPFFGGSASVWNTCMLFFQSLLLGGYFYAHLIAHLQIRWQAGMHCGLVLLCSLSVRLLPQSESVVTGEADPTVQILWLLLGTVGAYYFLLSATAPLLQRWYVAWFQESPYRLYASSNAGSLLGLLVYPLVLEPLLALSQQEIFWRLGFYTMMALVAGMLAASCRVQLSSLPAGAAEATAESADRGVTWTDAAWWFALAAIPSILLLAVTNKVSVDIAPFPLLWVIPLALYLLSFIICFDRPAWYAPRAYQAALIVGLMASGFFLRERMPFMVTFATVLFFVLFVACMVCHGELYQRRPHPRYLTSYYLVVAAGGAFGGFCVAILAPRLFSGYYELPIAAAACLGLSLYCRPIGSIGRLAGVDSTRARVLTSTLSGFASLVWLSRDLTGSVIEGLRAWMRTIILTPVEYFALWTCCAIFLGALLVSRFRRSDGGRRLDTVGTPGRTASFGVIAAGIAVVVTLLMYAGAQFRMATNQSMNWRYLWFNPISMWILCLLLLPPLLRWFGAINRSDDVDLDHRDVASPKPEKDSPVSSPWLFAYCVLPGLMLWDALASQLSRPHALARLAVVVGAFVAPLLVPPLQCRSATARAWMLVACLMLSLLPAVVRNCALGGDARSLVDAVTAALMVLGTTSVAAGAANISSATTSGRGRRSFAVGGMVGGLLLGALAGELWPEGIATRGVLWVVGAVALANYLLPSSDNGVAVRVYQGLGVAIALLGFMVGIAPRSSDSQIVLTEQRNFYGVLRVGENRDAVPGERVLEHGFIVHGTELIDDDEGSAKTRRHEPTAYLGRGSGIGQLFGHLSPTQPRHIGIVGLGVATLAAYGEPGYRLRFYEIDPAVVVCAKQYFSFLKECPSELEILVGDGRLALEREPDQAFDVLVLDAFSGDAVPTHLLTEEAVNVYLRHLKPAGYLVFNISNTHLDFSPILNEHAQRCGLNLKYVYTERSILQAKALWAILSPGELPTFVSAPHPPISDRQLGWTDHHHSILPLIRWAEPEVRPELAVTKAIP